jgi:hypothetical protein
VIAGLTLSCNSSASAFDATPPKLEDCKVTPVVLPESGGELTFSAKITSINGLERTPIVRMFNKDMTRWIADVVSMNRIAGDSKSGIYQGKVTVGANLKPDRYYVAFDSLWDLSLNRTGQIWCSDAFVDYGGYQPPVPTPTAVPTPTPVPTPTTSSNNASAPKPSEVLFTALSSLEKLKSQNAMLIKELKLLNAKLSKICTAKPKPKGC